MNPPKGNQNLSGFYYCKEPRHWKRVTNLSTLDTFSPLTSISNSVQFSHSVVSNSSRPLELQHVGPPCPTPTPGAYQTHIHWVGDAIQPSHPLSSPSFPAFNFSPIQGLFQWVSSLHQWPKYWSFSISPSNEYSGLISSKMNWMDFLAVQGTLKSLLQHLSSKASILQHSAFFIVQLSHPCMTTRKTIAWLDGPLLAK